MSTIEINWIGFRCCSSAADRSKRGVCLEQTIINEARTHLHERIATWSAGGIDFLWQCVWFFLHSTRSGISEINLSSSFNWNSGTRHNRGRAASSAIDASSVTVSFRKTVVWCEFRFDRYHVFVRHWPAMVERGGRCGGGGGGADDPKVTQESRLLKRGNKWYTWLRSRSTDAANRRPLGFTNEHLDGFSGPPSRDGDTELATVLAPVAFQVEDQSTTFKERGSFDRRVTYTWTRSRSLGQAIH